jgi:uncharacterized protein (TIGR00661 family)
MRILYGVAAQGMGHVTRARVLLEALARKHEVLVATSGLSFEYLRTRTGPHIHLLRIPLAQHLVFEGNRVRRRKTFTVNLFETVRNCRENASAYRTIERFAPSLVLSDFDRFSAVFAKRAGLPLWTVDNNQALARCVHPRDLYDGPLVDRILARWVAKLQALGAHHHFITTFFRAPLRDTKTTLHPPVLRPEVTHARPGAGEHLLAYQGASIDRTLIEALSAVGSEVRIYAPESFHGAGRKEGNLHFRPFSEHTFIEDLRTARGVVTSAGSTLIGEALHLRRAILSIPIAGQVEQELNAGYLEREGLGLRCVRPDSRQLAEFIERIPEIERKLTSYAPHHKTDLVDAIERSLSTL